jgi:hypothetical protein
MSEKFDSGKTKECMLRGESNIVLQSPQMKQENIGQKIPIFLL